MFGLLCRGAQKLRFCAPLTIYLEETENGFVTCFLLTYLVLTVTIFLGCCSLCQEIADPVSVRRLDTSETVFYPICR